MLDFLRRCFRMHVHQWSRYADPVVKTVLWPPDPQPYETQRRRTVAGQRRVCETCGLVQWRQW